MLGEPWRELLWLFAYAVYLNWLIGILLIGGLFLSGSLGAVPFAIGVGALVGNFIWIRLRHGEGLDDYGARFDRGWWRRLALGMVAGACIGLAMFAAAYYAGHVTVQPGPDLRTRVGAAAAAVRGIAWGLFAGLGFALIDQGYVGRRLSTRVHPLLAVATALALAGVSAAVSPLSLFFRWPPLLTVVNDGLTSALFFLIAYLSRDVWVAAGIASIKVAAGVFLIDWSGGQVQKGGLLTLAGTGPEIYHGGLYGLGGSLWGTIAWGGAALIVSGFAWWRWRKRQEE